MRTGRLPSLMLVAAAPFLLAAAPAGGWSFAHWGMSQAAVRAASGGKAHAPADDPQDPDDVVDGGAAIDRFHFDVTLKYAAEGLAQINLRLQGGRGDCAALGAYLKATYGPRFESDDLGGGYSTRIWTDAAHGNVVKWSRLGSGAEACEIELDPPG